MLEAQQKRFGARQGSHDFWIRSSRSESLSKDAKRGNSSACRTLRDSAGLRVVCFFALLVAQRVHRVHGSTRFIHGNQAVARKPLVQDRANHCTGRKAS